MSDVLIWSWIAFAVVVAAHRHLRGERVTARAPGTWLGIAIQAIGFTLVWLLRGSNAFGLPLPHVGSTPLLSVLEGVIGVSSILLAGAAIWTLGRNWSVAAQVVDGHRLVTTGPYRFVRHPIYTAMFGMLLATALSTGSPVGILLGLAVFVAGTDVRVRFEERLLRHHFGLEFEHYASSVPAYLPFTRRAGGV